MQCLFCKKEISGSGHVAACPVYIREVTEPLHNFVKKSTDNIRSLHTAGGLSAGDIAEELLSGFLKENTYSPEKQRYIKLKKAATTAEKVRLVLKESGIYNKSTTSRMARVRQTMLERYGVINNGQLPDARAKLSRRNNAKVYRLPARMDFESYSKQVKLFTDRSKRRLPAPCKDYYTQLPFLEELSDPFLMQGDLYPTIDHKLSVLYCFHKGLPAEACGDVSNLCWTFRWLNSLKQHLPEHLFRSTLLPLVEESIHQAVDSLIREGYHSCK